MLDTGPREQPVSAGGDTGSLMPLPRARAALAGRFVTATSEERPHDNEAEAGGERAQDRLAEVAERYIWLFEDSPVAKYICDVEGRILEVNSALCRLLGTLPAEDSGPGYGRLRCRPSTPGSRPGPVLRRPRRTFTSMRRYRGAEGRVLRAMVTLGAIRDASGQARTIFGEVEDLTAHYLATTELGRQRHRLEMAIEASGISVWELDVPSGRVTVQERTSGESEFREQSMTYGDFVRGFHPDDRGLLPTIRSLRSHACQELDLELRAVPARGTVRWVHLKGRVVRGEDGFVVRLAGTTADVTEPRAQRDELAAQRDRLELALETAEMMAWEVRLGPSRPSRPSGRTSSACTSRALCP